jgi:hypothetical protein
VSDETSNDVETTSAKPGSTWWAGVIVLAAVAPGVIVLGTRGRTGVAGQSGTLYDHSRWLLLALLAAAGIALVGAGALPVRWRVEVARVAATVGAITAAQLSTTGIVAAKHWHPLSGMTGYGAANLHRLVMLAEFLIAAAAVATLACLIVTRTAGVWRTGGPTRYRWAGVGLGIIVAVALPAVLGSGNAQTMGARSLAAYALLYSLPWGAVIAVCGWLGRIGAVTALATVAISAAAAYSSHYLLGVAHPARGFVPIAVLAAILATLPATSTSAFRRYNT